LSIWNLSARHIGLDPAVHDRCQTNDLKRCCRNTVSGLTTVLTFILMLTGTIQLWMLVCIGVVSAAAGAFHYAAFDASYAMLVPDSLLPRANGMMQTTWSLSGIVSPALAAFIIGLPALLPPGVALFAKIVALGDGTSLVIAIDAATFFLCVTILLLVYVPSPTRSYLATSGISKPRLWDDVREGALYICPGYVFASLGLIWLLFCMPQLFNPYLLRVEDSP